MTEDQAKRIRPGDHVEVWQDGMARGADLAPYLKNGDILEVDDPPQSIQIPSSHFMLKKSAGLSVAVHCGLLTRVDSAPPTVADQACRCDMMVLMTTGCRCGAIERERLATNPR